MIKGNLPVINKHTDINLNAGSVISKLFFTFNPEDSERSRKINRIIFADHVYVEKIGKYLAEQIYKDREARLIQILNLVVKHGMVKPFNAETAARMINRIFIACALEDSFHYPYRKNVLPPRIDELRNDCMFIVDQILSGDFRM